MKLLKIIATTILLLGITLGVPFIVYQIGSQKQYLTNVEGSNFQGPSGYLQKIVQQEDTSQTVKENAVKLAQEYSNLLTREKTNLLNLVLTISLILGMSITIFGIVLLKITKYKIVPSSMVTSGVIATICYIGMYITKLSTLLPIYSI